MKQRINSRKDYSRRRYRDGIDGGILDDDRLRIVLTGLFFLAAFLVIICRLYFLQLHRGEEHRKLIARQSERLVRVPGLRGNILSSDGIMLAGNRRSYDMLFFPSEMHQGSRKRTIAYMNDCTASIAGALGRGSFPGPKDFDRHLQRSPGVPMTVFRGLTEYELARAFEVIRNMKGVDIQLSPVRFNPENDLACHIIGYTRKDDILTASDRDVFRRYYNPDIVGKSGIEAAFDNFGRGISDLGLRAFPGRSVIQVNNIGYAHQELLGKTEPIHGNHIILNIDSRAQRIGEELLAAHTGAIVVLDADNGNILCAATSPRFELARFSPRLEPAYYQKLLNDPERPLINRAFQGIYPPGSTIKPLICMAFLHAGIDPDEEIFCHGESEIGDTRIGCSAHRYRDGDMNMILALEKSCNNYMIHHATHIGLEKIMPLIDSVGFGRKCGLPIPESAGDRPSPELKMRRYKTKWNEYDTALLSIGQGIISVTPLQLAVYTAAIANGGTVWKPQLVKELRDVRQITRYEFKPEAVAKLPISSEQLAVIRHGMFNVVNSSGGSGRQGRVDGLEVFGKTGTAEIGAKHQRQHITHFIAFTEFNGKRYALAVTVEGGGSGGRTCAPLAAEFFRRFLLD